MESVMVFYVTMAQCRLDWDGGINEGLGLTVGTPVADYLGYCKQGRKTHPLWRASLPGHEILTRIGVGRAS